MFFLMMVMMTFACTLVWQGYVNDRLYHCTDSGGFGYLAPGDWVHPAHGLVHVPEIVTHTSTSDPDTLKEGWSINRLWCL
jgi:hypothetical protein